VALDMDRQGEQVAIAEALRDRGGVARHGGGRLVLAVRLVPERLGQPEIAPFHALVVDEPLSARDPARAATELAGQQQRHARPERAPGRARLGTRPEVELVGARHGVDVLLQASQHVCRRRQLLEVGGPERSRPVGARQRGMGVQPRMSRDEGAAVLELVDGRHGVVHRRTPAAGRATVT
jgi:hypothetical protein